MPERSTKAITGQREEKMLLQRTRVKLEKKRMHFTWIKSPLLP